MSRHKKISGFTLIELILVISIVSILLLFSFPMFKNTSLFSNNASQVGDIARLINNLKNRAVEQNVDFILHMDSGSGLLWVTRDDMGEEAIVAAKKKGVLLSEKITIMDVESPGIRETGFQVHQIRFSRMGYSDFALIHVMVDDNSFTIKIEPFLSRVQVQDGHVYLEECS